jgi:hypothetical protein
LLAQIKIIIRVAVRRAILDCQNLTGRLLIE